MSSIARVGMRIWFSVLSGEGKEIIIFYRGNLIESYFRMDREVTGEYEEICDGVGSGNDKLEMYFV